MLIGWYMRRIAGGTYSTVCVVDHAGIKGIGGVKVKIAPEIPVGVSLIKGGRVIFTSHRNFFLLNSNSWEHLIQKRCEHQNHNDFDQKVFRRGESWCMNCLFSFAPVPSRHFSSKCFLCNLNTDAGKSTIGVEIIPQ
jgi:hypothetical protein